MMRYVSQIQFVYKLWFWGEEVKRVKMGGEKFIHSLKARNTFVIIEVSSKYSQDWFANSAFGEMSKTESIWTEMCH